DCIFCKIANKQILKEFIYGDEDVMVFSDIKPIKPVHLLIMPKKHVPDFLDADPVLFERLARVIQQMIRREGLQDKGYRLIVNGGGAQIVNHLHIHLTGPFGKAVQM
ncbi:MAG: HIT domain-containing protein, partial [Candidatus Levybacteria bacterium]|nr:HIT domain-containing protein [Candidatus Levybacteria bacterium]